MQCSAKTMHCKRLILQSPPRLHPSVIPRNRQFGWSAFVWMVKNSASANNVKKAQGLRREVYALWFRAGHAESNPKRARSKQEASQVGNSNIKGGPLHEKPRNLELVAVEELKLIAFLGIREIFLRIFTK